MTTQKKSFRIIVMGSGELAAPALEALLADGRDDIAAVITQPDRAAGRGLHAAACCMKQLALERRLPVFDPPDINADDIITRLSALEPDIILVAAYGQFLSKRILAIPRRATLNIHPSLLPKYRGASPIQWTLANGDRETGVSILYVTPQMDAGDILMQGRMPVAPDDTYATLAPKLAAQGAALLLQTLDAFRSGTAKAMPQAEADVTFARKLKKEDGCIFWAAAAEEIVNRWRGFSPWPGAYTTLPNGTLLKIHRMELNPAHSRLPAGTVTACNKNGVDVAAGQGTVRLLDVQPAGKSKMTAAAFICGRYLSTGDRLGAHPAH